MIYNEYEYKISRSTIYISIINNSNNTVYNRNKVLINVGYSP